MMYLDGGGYTGIAVPTYVVSGLISVAFDWCVGQIASKFGVAKGTISKVLKYLGWGGNIFISVGIGDIIANRMDSSRNGWIGLYTGGRWGYYTQ